MIYTITKDAVYYEKNNTHINTKRITWMQDTVQPAGGEARYYYTAYTKDNEYELTKEQYEELLTIWKSEQGDMEVTPRVRIDLDDLNDKGVENASLAFAKTEGSGYASTEAIEAAIRAYLEYIKKAVP